MGLLFAVLFVASVSLMRAGLPDIGMSPAEVEPRSTTRTTAA